MRTLKEHLEKSNGGDGLKTKARTNLPPPQPYSILTPWLTHSTSTSRRDRGKTEERQKEEREKPSLSSG
jgi:hypothetical protein